MGVRRSYVCIVILILLVHQFCYNINTYMAMAHGLCAMDTCRLANLTLVKVQSNPFGHVHTI